MGPVGHGRGDDERLRLPALFKALLDQSCTLCEEKARFAAPLLPFKTFQGLNERIRWAGDDLNRMIHGEWGLHQKSCG